MSIIRDFNNLPTERKMYVLLVVALFNATGIPMYLAIVISDKLLTVLRVWLD